MKLSDLKTHGKAIQEHNFNTQKCKVRDFDHMKTNLAGQIRRLGEDDISVDTFSELVIKEERHDVERLFRDRGKNHESVVGLVNTGVASMQYIIGGPLHNEIGLGNDLVDHLLAELTESGLGSTCDEIRNFLNTSKVDGGAGCTPGQHHGGKYNGRLLYLHEYNVFCQTTCTLIIFITIFSKRFIYLC